MTHGWDDPEATPSDVLGLESELTARRSEWQLLALGNTGRAFTHPRANSPDDGIVYCPTATDRAWRVAEWFLTERFWLVAKWDGAERPDYKDRVF